MLLKRIIALTVLTAAGCFSPKYGGGEFQCAAALQTTTVTFTVRLWQSQTSMATSDLLFVVQVLEELREELGLSESLVGSTRPFILVEDVAAHVIDIGFHIELSASFDEIKAAMAARTNEYSEIDWVDKSDIDQFCKAKDVLPV